MVYLAVLHSLEDSCSEIVLQINSKSEKVLRPSHPGAAGVVLKMRCSDFHFLAKKHTIPIAC